MNENQTNDNLESGAIQDTPTQSTQPTPNAQPTKKCKHCQTDIPAKAKVCPHCRKRQKASGCLVSIVVFIFIVLIMIIASLGSDTDDAKLVDTDNVTKETSNETPKTEEKLIFKVGETAEYKNVLVSLVGYEESDGGDWGSPEDGNVFVFVNLEFANNSEKEITVSSMVSFSNYCDDYKLDFSSNAFMALATDKAKQQLDGSVDAGKKLNGYLAFEVPQDWKELEIQYTDSLWASSKIKFVIEK